MKRQIVLLGIILIVLIAGSYAFGKSDIKLNAVFGKVGYVMPGSDIDATFGFGGGVNLGTITPKIGLEAELWYWKKGYEEKTDYYKVTSSASELNIAAIARYKLGKPGAKIQPEVGGGVGLAMSKVSSEMESDYPFMKTASPMAPMAIDGDGDSVSDTGLAIHLSGLIRTALSPQIEGIAELRYTLNGFDHLGIWVGISYLLNK